MEGQGEKPKQGIDYYQSYCRLVEENKALKCQLESLVKSRQQIIDQSKRETRSNKPPSSDVETIEEKVFVKRKSIVYPRIHICPFNQCQKAYSSQISVRLHIKIRHPSEYEQWLEQKQNNDLETQLSQLNIDEKVSQQGEGSNKQSLSWGLKLTTNTVEEEPKRNRRRHPSVPRTHICPQNACGKSYCTPGSLNQHMKIRHPSIYQKWLEENRSKDIQAKLNQLSLNDSKMDQ